MSDDRGWLWFILRCLRFECQVRLRLWLRRDKWEAGAVVCCVRLLGPAPGLLW